MTLAFPTHCPRDASAPERTRQALDFLAKVVNDLLLSGQLSLDGNNRFYISTLGVTNASVVNAAITNATIAKLIATNSQVTNETVTALTATSLTATSLTATNETFTNLTGTNGAVLSANTGNGGLTIAGNNAQKMALWGSTPVIQPSSSGELVGSNGNGATNANAVNMNSNGNLGNSFYSFPDAIKALKQLGGLKP